MTSCDQVGIFLNLWETIVLLVLSSFSSQVKRKICAEDHCRVVEGEEECHDKVVETAIEVLGKKRRASKI